MDCSFEARGLRGRAVWPLRLVVTCCVALLLPISLPTRAVEILYTAPAPESLPLRRLAPDPARPEGAPTSIEIEYAAVQDDADTALGLAARALEASEQAYGREDVRTIIPLTNLGVARQRAGQTSAAIADFRRAIEIAEGLSSPRDLRVAEANYGLGVALYQLGAAQSAITAFENGLQQHRIGRGLYSAEQIDFLRALVVANRSLGRIKDGAYWQQKRVEVAEQALAENAEVLAWNYVNAGRWFREVRDFDQAMALHGRAVDVIQQERGSEDSLLIGPLMDLTITGSQWRQGKDSPLVPLRHRPHVALTRAYRLALARTDGTPEQRARTLERVGNLNWLFGRRREALRAYARAEEIAKGLASAPDFGLPAFLVFRPPGIPSGWDALRGHVLAEFSVDASGRAKDVEIVEGLPPELSEAVGGRLRAALRSSRLRPRLSGGRPASTEEVRYRMVLTPSSQKQLDQQG